MSDKPTPESLKQVIEGMDFMPVEELQRRLRGALPAAKETFWGGFWKGLANPWAMALGALFGLIAGWLA